MSVHVSGTKARAPRVVVTIDRLVLRGFRAADRDTIAASLAAELQRRLGEAVVMREIGASRAVASLVANPVRGAQGAASRAVGTNAARNIVQSVCR